MARKLPEMPERPKPWRHAAKWAKYANGEVWELDMIDDLETAHYAEKIDDDKAKLQHRAIRAARQWGRNNGFVVNAYRMGYRKIVVKFTRAVANDPAAADMPEPPEGETWETGHYTYINDPDSAGVKRVWMRR